jgi:hypothetical protein
MIWVEIFLAFKTSPHHQLIPWHNRLISMLRCCITDTRDYESATYGNLTHIKILWIEPDGSFLGVQLVVKSLDSNAFRRILEAVARDEMRGQGSLFLRIRLSHIVTGLLQPSHRHMPHLF